MSESLKESETQFHDVNKVDEPGGKTQIDEPKI